jgi:hypothetical protein
MAEPSLKAGIWISAQVRLCDMQSLPAVVRRRGDPDAGSIIIRIDRLDGSSKVLTQIRDANGQRCWLTALGEDAAPDPEVEAYIERRLTSDPDIWVLEIEDRDGRYEADAPIVT